MATLPNANTRLAASAGGFSGGTGLIMVAGCVGKNADGIPRYYTSLKSLLAQHDYAPAVGYTAIHFNDARTPVLFVGLPVATAGVVGRQNSTGVTGTCAITVAAAVAGIMEAVDGVVTVTKGGTVGTDQIGLEISMDGGRSTKKYRLGTNNSYTVPYLGIVINFGAGTLNVGDKYTFSTTAPMWDQAAIQDLRENLAEQKRLTRTWLIEGDCQDEDDAADVLEQVNLYATTHKRFVMARVQVRDRIPLASMSKITKRMTGAPNITFAEVGGTGDTIARSSGSFVDDGIAVGDIVTVSGAVASAGANNVTGVVVGVTATTLTLDTTDLVSEGPISGVTITASPAITFAEVGATSDTVARSSGSWIADGFRVGDKFTVTGAVASSGANNVVDAPIVALTATLITLGTTDLVTESVRQDTLTITKGETHAAFVAAMDAEFADIDNAPRIDIGLGRVRKTCPITGWKFRRPAQWRVSVAEYKHEIHTATWAKELGPEDGWDIEDADGMVVEHDEATDGGALGGRFTCLRTWSNGPEGVFVARSLTRAVESSVLSNSHHMQVANLFCSIVQAEAEMAVGKNLVIDPESGFAEEASLKKIEKRVNKKLQRELLRDTREGQRASAARWTANRTDDLSGPEPKLTGKGFLVTNATLVEVETEVEVQNG